MRQPDPSLLVHKRPREFDQIGDETHEPNKTHKSDPSKPDESDTDFPEGEYEGESSDMEYEPDPRLMPEEEYDDEDVMTPQQLEIQRNSSDANSNPAQTSHLRREFSRLSSVSTIT